MSLKEAAFTLENFNQGLLFQGDRMVGITELAEQTNALPKSYCVFVTNIETMENQSLLEFATLHDAIAAANGMIRATQFEAYFERFGCSKGPSCRGATKGNCPTCSNSH